MASLLNELTDEETASIGTGTPVQAWGDYAEMESPTQGECLRVVRSLSPEPEQEQELVIPLKSPEPKPPPQVPEPVRRAHRQELEPEDELAVRVRATETMLKDLEQALVRYGILFDQFVQRTDGVIQQITRHQAAESRSLQDAKKTIQALVTEVGPDRVKEVMHEIQNQKKSSFGGQRNLSARDGGLSGAQTVSCAREEQYEAGGWGGTRPHRNGRRSGGRGR
jgi:hypothetical protein